jgi:hypothetical protein
MTGALDSKLRSTVWFLRSREYPRVTQNNITDGYHRRLASGSGSTLSLESGVAVYYDAIAYCRDPIMGSAVVSNVQTELRVLSEAGCLMIYFAAQAAGASHLQNIPEVTQHRRVSRRSRSYRGASRRVFI